MLAVPVRTALAASVLFLVACDVPRFKGPQVQAPPPAFTMKKEATQQRRMFPARAVVYHDAWVEASWGNFSGIYINGHVGALGKGEVEAALRQAKADAAGERIEFGGVEAFDVDGRTAWGWGETWRLENGGLQYVIFRAAIPYDTITYAVDFLTGDPGLKIRPDSLRTVVASFEVGRTRWNLPMLLIGSGLMVFLVGIVRSRSQQRVARARHIPLVKIPAKPQGDPPGHGPGDQPGRATAAATAPAGGASPGTAKTQAPPSSVADAIRRSTEARRPGSG